VAGGGGGCDACLPDLANPQLVAATCAELYACFVACCCSMLSAHTVAIASTAGMSEGGDLQM
jgi:hypothetical protein